MSLSLISRALLGAGFLAASFSQPAAARFSEPSTPIERQPITGSFSGFIIDQYTGRPLQQATVALVRKDNEQLIAGAMSADNGEFRLDRATFGHYILSIEVPGYEPVEEQVTLAAGRDLIDLGTVGMIPLKVQAAAQRTLPSTALALDGRP